MDYDADGILDFISGSYDPGDVYLFRGLGEGKYAARRLLRDEADVPIVHHPKDLVAYHALQKAGKKKDAKGKEAVYFRLASFGSWPAMVDWDADGDLDMLIGSFSGRLFLRTNKGTRKKPVFARESVPVHAAGAPLRVAGHLNPVVVDWDGDGRWDLVTGAANGAVQWFRNTGSERKPEFSNAQELLPARAENKFCQQFFAHDETPGRGTRAQICVTDYNGDGKLDLLVGDYSDVWRQRSGISDADQKKLSKLVSEEAQLRGANDKKALSAVIKKKHSFYEKKGRHSYVWLYLRK